MPRRKRSAGAEKALEMRHLNLRSKLFVAFGIVLLPVLLLLIMGLRSNLGWRQSLILDDQRLAAEAVAVQVDGAFDAAIGLAWAVANDPLVQTLDSKRLDSHLKQLMLRYPAYQAISVFDANGMNRGYGHLTIAPEPRFSIAGMEHFQTVMATNAPAISKVIQLRRPAGVPGVVAAVPLRNEAGQTIGVVTVVMSAEQMAQRYNETRLLPGQAIVLLDRAGRVAFHSLRRNMTFDNSTAFDRLPPVRDALAGKAALSERFADPLTNEIRMGVFVPTLQHRWAVGVTMPPALAMAPFYNLLRQQLGVFIGILLLSVVLATMMARYLLHPFLRLTEAARALGRGDLARRVEIHTGDEIEDLGASFNEMAQQLQERDRALHERENRIRRLMESNIIGIFFWNLKGGIIDANDAFLRIIGYSREELLSGALDWSQITPQEHRVADERAVDELLQSGSCKPYDKEYLRKDGQRVSVLLGGALLEGSQENGVAFVLDLTERKRAEDELKQHRDHLDELVKARTSELVVAKEVAESANRAKSIFLANMSHELRTPLNAILGYAQILLWDRKSNERDTAGLNTIRQSGEHLLTLINDILDLSKIEAGKIDLYPDAVHLHAFLLGIADSMRIKAEQKTLAFNYDTSAGLPAAVQVDGKRLRQILLNLLGNAVKYTDYGEVKLHVELLERQETTARLRFEVTDSGIGIARDKQETIFSPFEQAGDLYRRLGGTGLGLAISRQLARLMGSEIHLHSEPGRGSRFWFDLDLPLVDMDAAVQIPHPESVVIGYRGERKNILVVDDIAGNRELVTDFLQPLGFEIREAENGAEALEKVQTARPDLIVMDVVMPVMDGLEATRRLRKLPAGRDVPIIAVSASASIFDQEQSLAMGASAFLPKPINLDRLREQIDAQLRLTWLYAHEGSTSEPPEEVAMPLIAPPPEEMEKLHYWARIGNMREIRQQAAHITALGEQYAPFANHLHRLANELQSRKILDFVKSHLNQEVE